MLYLSKGRIPAWIVLSEIENWLAEQNDSSFNTNDDGALRILAERSGMRVDTLSSWFRPSGAVQSIAFDDADLLFCKMNRHDLWRLKYSDYYYGVNLDSSFMYHRDRERERENNECLYGHKRTPENTKIRKDGRRECRACQQAASRRCYKRKMARAA